MAKKRNKRPISTFARAVGARLRAARKAGGIKLETLGERLGVTSQQIQNYETGKSRLYDAKIVEACDALEIDPNKLLGWNEHAETKPHFILWGDRRLILTDYDSIFEAGFLIGSHRV
ncbi:helix-turn-helix domain-containing protein [Bradyrhizobium sp. TM233]|uniref:helix-turn-helix domain-containing protein n=1 Tax=Bradyrhizobium sp. TM233 TaxID=2599801 RepID=UPI0027D69774|nr:hypothetical protein TM233_28090 [Bradyrhizobium sp. TM233]